MISEQPRKRLLTVNDPQQMRIYKDLAAEIGLEESIILLQIEFLIATSKNYRDGKYWTFQSVRQLQKKHFPWWHYSTVSRIINNLIANKLLIAGNYNKLPLDKTPWYTLNEEGVSQLKSVQLVEIPLLQSATSMPEIATAPLQIATSALQTATSALQIATTIPEISSKNSLEEQECEIARAREDTHTPTDTHSLHNTPTQALRAVEDQLQCQGRIPKGFTLTAELESAAQSRVPGYNVKWLFDLFTARAGAKAHWLALDWDMEFLSFCMKEVNAGERRGTPPPKLSDSKTSAIKPFRLKVG